MTDHVDTPLIDVKKSLVSYLTYFLYDYSTIGYCLLKVSQPYGVSLEDIKHEAIVLYCDTTGTPRSDIENHNFTVDLEFRDNENDIILVKTDIDLRNFSASLPSSYVGKVYASVINTTHVNTEPNAAATSTSTQTESRFEDKINDDLMIVNAITDIFSIAAMSMKAGISAAMTAKQLTSDVVNKEAKNARKVSKESLKAVKKLAKEHSKVFLRAVKGNEALKSVSIEPSVAEVATCRDQESFVSNDVGKGSGEDIKQEKTAEVASSVIPFIHGRHTCDQCLTTPIIGTRYHALNLPDYDLCANCYGNYKGSEIVFEEAQLGTYISGSLFPLLMSSQYSVSRFHITFDLHVQNVMYHIRNAGIVNVPCSKDI